MRRHALLVIQAALVPSINAWTSLGMQLYGGQVEEFALETRGQTGLGFEYSATQRLYLRRGQIWSLPEDETSTHGLSGGITYAWDPQLCGQLLPLMRENVANLISCDDLKASLQRGFDAWAMNSRHIKFVDVSTACEKQYTLTKDCPLAEIWVAALSCEFVSALCEDNPNTDTSSLTWAAAATPKFALSNSFRFTNGEYNKVGNVVQPSIEIVGGTLLFNIGTPAAPGMCWYLDSAFCSNFHAMKAAFPGSTPAVQAANAKVVIIVLFWTIWLSTIALFLYSVFWVFTPRKAFWDELKEALEDGTLDGEDMKELEEARKQYIKNTMKRIAKYETIAVAFIITVIVGLPLLYWQLFLPCWDCYDFEGAAVHEAGHLLGLGHPDAFPTLSQLPSFAPDIGKNVYNALLADGSSYNSTTCINNWDAVFSGLPASADAEDETSVRDAVMESFTQNNPSQCLSADDAEGLHTLYPDCDGLFYSTMPNCIKVNLNFGVVRVFLYLGIPLLVVVWVMLVFDYFVDNYIRVPSASEMKQKVEIRRQVAGKAGAASSEELAWKENAAAAESHAPSHSSQHTVSQGLGPQRPKVGGYYREQLPPMRPPSQPAA